MYENEPPNTNDGTGQIPFPTIKVSWAAKIGILVPSFGQKPQNFTAFQPDQSLASGSLVDSRSMTTVSKVWQRSMQSAAFTKGA